MLQPLDDGVQPVRDGVEHPEERAAAAGGVERVAQPVDPELERREVRARDLQRRAALQRDPADHADHEHREQGGGPRGEPAGGRRLGGDGGGPGPRADRRGGRHRAVIGSVTAGHRGPAPSRASTSSRCTTPSVRSPSTTRTGRSVASTRWAASATRVCTGSGAAVADGRVAGVADQPAQRQHARLRHVADEVADVVVGRRPHHLVRRPDLDDLAVAHDQDPVAELERLAEVVGDEDHGLAHVAVQPDDLVLHVAADQRVEGGERLVEEDQRGVRGQRPPEADALLHAAGQLVGERLLVARQPDEVDDLLRPGEPLAAGLPAHLEPEGDVVDHPAVRQQPEVLEHHGDVAPPQVAEPGGRHGRHVVALDAHRARRRLDEAGQAAHQGRLAGPGQAHDHEHLAGRHVERHVADRRRAPRTRPQLGPRQVGLRAAGDAPRAWPEHLPEVRDLQRRSAHDVLPSTRSWSRAYGRTPPGAPPTASVALRGSPGG